MLLNTWKRMDVIGQAQELRDNLICAFEHKFEYELSSQIYLAASIVEVKNLNLRFKRSFAKDFIKLIHDAISNACLRLVDFEEDGLEPAKNAKDLPKSTSSVSISSDKGNFLNHMTVTDRDDGEYVDGLLNTRRGKIIEREVDSLFRLFQEKDLKKLKST